MESRAKEFRGGRNECFIEVGKCKVLITQYNHIIIIDGLLKLNL